MTNHRPSYFTEHIQSPSRVPYANALFPSNRARDSAIDLTAPTEGPRYKATKPMSLSTQANTTEQTYDEILVHSVEVVISHLPIWRLMRIYHPFFFPFRPRPEDLLSQGTIRSATSQLNIRALAATFDLEIAAKQHLAKQLWHRMTDISCPSYTSEATQKRAVRTVLNRTKIPVALIQSALALYIADLHTPPSTHTHLTSSSATALAANKHWNALAQTLSHDTAALSDVRSSAISKLINDMSGITGLCHDDFLHALAKCKNTYFSFLSGSHKPCRCGCRGGQLEYRLRKAFDSAIAEPRELAAAQGTVANGFPSSASRVSPARKQSRTSPGSSWSSKTRSLESIKEEVDDTAQPEMQVSATVVEDTKGWEQVVDDEYAMPEPPEQAFVRA